MTTTDTTPGLRALSIRHSIRMAQARAAGTLVAVSRSGVAAITDQTPDDLASAQVAQLTALLHDAVIEGAGDARLTPVTFLHLHGEQAVEWLASAMGPDLTTPAVAFSDEAMVAALRASDLAVLVAATVLVDTRLLPKPARVPKPRR